MMRPALSRGATLIEMLVVVTLGGLLLLCAGQLLRVLGDATLAAGARDLAMTFRALRWRAVAEQVTHGVRFERDLEGWRWSVVADGNGNGLRTAEIERGTDPTLRGPYRVQNRFPNLKLGLLGDGSQSWPQIPPRSGRLSGADPIRFGRSDIVSFSPLGRSSSGTLFLSDGRDGMVALVLFGPTARIRVWHFDQRTGGWQI